jgi:hypothetical protein
MPDYEQLFRESGKAYDSLDYEKMMTFVTEDYSFFSMTDEGPVLRAKGKEQAKAGLKMVLESGVYVKGEVAFLKTFGNIVVALEKDQYREGDGIVTRDTLAVYEYEGDKMARAYSFSLSKD